MVLHHVGTNDSKRAKAFYDPLMRELGLRLIKETERIIAYGLMERQRPKTLLRHQQAPAILPRAGRNIVARAIQGECIQMSVRTLEDKETKHWDLSENE
jgi:hypothetical protein